MCLLRILLVEDNPDDVDLTREALEEADIDTELLVAVDGIVAMKTLRDATRNGKQADLILLDLNLPRMSGFQVLEEIKADADLRRIPVVVLTTSDELRDVTNAYDCHANAYVVKPVDLDEFITSIKGITEFWGTIAKLPPA